MANITESDAPDLQAVKILAMYLSPGMREAGARAILRLEVGWVLNSRGLAQQLPKLLT